MAKLILCVHGTVGQGLIRQFIHPPVLQVVFRNWQVEVGFVGITRDTAAFSY